MTASALVLFDGECGLCDRAVRFLAARDRAGRLRFAPLQGEAAALWRDRARGAGGGLDWLLLVEDPTRGTAAAVHVRAAAVARALRIAGGAWGAVGALLSAVPRPIADAAYLAVARRRRRLAPSCPLPARGDPRFLR